MEKNVAFIYEPHFKTNMFRVAVSNQQGKTNFIVVTCSPKYNGVWKWEKQLDKSYDTWVNGKCLCYCIPISECIKVQEISTITRQDVLSEIKKQQEYWYNSQVKNRDYTYKNKPEWML